MSFEPLQPRNLGHYIEAPVKAETRALEAVQAYIDGLRQQIATYESLRDSLATVILELVRELRLRETEDFILLGKLDELETRINEL